MSVQVQWGKLKFQVSGGIVRGVKDFNASLAIKKDDSKSKKKYTENETLSFTITTSIATGGNPIKDYDFLKTYIGYPAKGSKLKVNNGSGTSLSAWKGGKFKLEGVDLSGTSMDSYGRILSAEIKLSFVEVGTKKVGKKGKVKKFRKQSNIKGTW